MCQFIAQEPDRNLQDFLVRRIEDGITGKISSKTTSTIVEEELATRMPNRITGHR